MQALKWHLLVTLHFQWPHAIYINPLAVDLELASDITFITTHMKS